MDEVAHEALHRCPKMVLKTTFFEALFTPYLIINEENFRESSICSTNVRHLLCLTSPVGSGSGTIA